MDVEPACDVDVEPACDVDVEPGWDVDVEPGWDVDVEPGWDVDGEPPGPTVGDTPPVVEGESTVALVVLWAGNVVVEVSAVSVASRLTRKKVGARSLVVANTTPIATTTTAR